MRRVRINVASVALNGLLMPALALVALFPILWMVAVAIKPEVETYRTPISWLPEHPTLNNFVAMWRELDFNRFFLNTLIVAGSTTLASIAVATPAAYALSRWRFRGGRLFYTFLLSTQMFPRVILIVLYFITMRYAGLINSYTALVLIYVSFSAPLCVWMLVGHFAQVPLDLDEAAVIDGSGPLGVFLRIILPLCLPGVVATAVFSFLLGWNEFLFALILTTERSMSVITVGLASLIGEFKTQWNALMAASLVGSVPAMVLYGVLERFLVRGLAAGATKG